MSNDEKPDVEEIMRNIRADLAGVERLMPPASVAIEPENDLYHAIHLVNQHHAIDIPAGSGIRGVLKRAAYHLLAGSFCSIGAFHAAVTHALNKMLKLLEGSHDDLSGELLRKTRARMDLLESIEERLALVEDRLALIEKRSTAEADRS